MCIMDFIDGCSETHAQVETVGSGTECGVILAGWDDVRAGDVLRCITMESRSAQPREIVSQPSRQYQQAA